jgi:outer membrane protein OmpA-like peptidoglycan-associated protein
MKTMGVLLAATLLALPGLREAVAQQAPNERGAPVSNATVDEFVEALKPRPLTRSLGASGRNLRVEPARIDLTIQFDFDSARVLPESRPMLERLAVAMQTEPLSALRFQIEGHTDGQGTAHYNELLSQRRAQAVVDILTRGGITLDRLQPIGKGFTELLDPTDPASARNRRVRVLVQQ